MTAFLANIVRDDKRRLEPYTVGDFMPDWNAAWDAVSKLSTAPEPLTDEEEYLRTEALAGKVINLNTWFGGVGG